MNDRRLLACAELCVRGGVAVDVGTDHGSLAVYLIEQDISEQVIACDINEKPLASAKKNISEAGLTDKISTVISDGLDNISCDGVTNVIIAGMGGELIADIISRADWLKERKVNLVLQPMTKWDHLRRFLAENGFEVMREIPCIDGRFVYSVMQAVFSGSAPKQRCTLEYLYGGTVSGNTEEGRAYLMRQAQRLETVGQGIAHDAAKAEDARKYFEASKSLRDRGGL